MNRPTTEHEAKGGILPKILNDTLAKYHQRIERSQRRGGLLLVDRDTGFWCGSAWDVLLAAGWRTNDGGHRQIIEPRATDASDLIRNAEPCDCDDCNREKSS